MIRTALAVWLIGCAHHAAVVAERPTRWIPIFTSCSDPVEIIRSDHITTLPIGAVVREELRAGDQLRVRVQGKVVSVPIDETMESIDVVTQADMRCKVMVSRP